MRRWKRRHEAVRESLRSCLGEIRRSPSKKNSADQCVRLYMRADRALADCARGIEKLDVTTWEEGRRHRKARFSVSEALGRVHSQVRDVCEMHRKLSVVMVLVVREKHMQDFEKPFSEGAHWERGFTRLRYLLRRVDGK
jgi:hypothetical protein